MQTEVIPTCDILSSDVCTNMEETIMEGHMREHCPLYTCVPFVTIDEGGWVGWWVVVCIVVVSGEWCGWWWWWWSEGSGRAYVPVFVVSCSLLSSRSFPLSIFFFPLSLFFSLVFSSLHVFLSLHIHVDVLMRPIWTSSTCFWQR